MDDTKLLQQIEELSRRMARVEARLGLDESASTNIEITEPIASSPPMRDAMPPSAVEVIAIEPNPLPPDAAPVADVTHDLPPAIEMDAPSPAIHLPGEAARRFAREALPVVPYASKVQPRPHPKSSARSGESIERAIGLKWAGWIGAIVLVIGAGFGIKYAYDQGWFGILPPAGRFALMSLGGFALIAAGEWVYRKVNTVSAAGLFGAGVATLFLVSYAGHGFYGLYNRDVAFVMMGLSTLIGAAVAMRGNLVSIGVLSILGGNIAPLVLRSDHPHLVPFLCYLLMLQIVALFLSFWGGREKWWTMRGVSIATTALWGGALLFAERNADPFGSMFVFLFIYAVLYQIELIASAFRHGRTEPARKSEAAAVVSMMVTAGLTVGMLFLLRDQSHETRGVCVLLIGAACSVIGFALRWRCKPTEHALSVGYRLQAAALLIVAVPVALSGVWVILGWAGLALAFAALGAMRDLEISRHAAAMTWMFAVADLVLWANNPLNRADAAWWTLWGHGIPAYTIVAWMLALVAHTIGLLVGSKSRLDKRQLDVVLHVLAGATWVVASMIALPPLGATFSIVVYVWLLVAAHAVGRRPILLSQAIVLLVLATVKWTIVDTLADRLGLSPANYAPLVNPMTGLGVLIAASLAAVYWLRRDALPEWLKRRTGDEGDARLPLAGVLIAMMTVALSVDIDRVVLRAALAGPMLWPTWQVRQMAWTMLWTVSLIAYGAAAHFLAPSTARERYLKWPSRLMLLLTAKFVLVDALGPRVLDGVVAAMPIANLQMLAALFIVGGLLAARTVAPRDPANRRRAILGFIILVVMLIVGTLEVDRAFERLAIAGSTILGNPLLAKQVAISIFWATIATVLIIAGFRGQSAPLRYFALTLFALTLAKVMTVDLGHAGTAYRIVSFIGLGMLLLGTSVLYGKQRVAQG